MLRHLLFWLLPPITLYFPTYTYFRQFWVKSQRSITLNNSKTRNGRVHICHSTRCWKSHLASDNYDSRGHPKSKKPAETLLLCIIRACQRKRPQLLLLKKPTFHNKRLLKNHMYVGTNVLWITAFSLHQWKTVWFGDAEMQISVAGCSWGVCLLQLPSQ